MIRRVRAAYQAFRSPKYELDPELSEVQARTGAVQSQLVKARGDIDRAQSRLLRAQLLLDATASLYQPGETE